MMNLRENIFSGCVVALCLWLAACSSDDLAGTLIETNTGNKVLIETNTGSGMARVMVAVDDFGISAGDSVQLLRSVRDTIGDSILISKEYFEDVANGLDIAKGYVEMENVPAMNYDSLAVVTAGGDARSFVIDLDAIDGETYKISSEGAKMTSDVIPAMRKIRIELPEGFEELSTAGEIFTDMPLPIRLETRAMSPCLIDADSNIIPLAVSVSDSLLYWTRLSQVNFAEDGSIQFDLLENCTASETVELSRRTVNFDDETSKLSSDAPFGIALWTDSTDMFRVIDNFEPFTNNGTQMTASIWIKGDSASQGAMGKSYTRILSAKCDSAAFILQQRANQAAVNLRIDSHSNGKGVYNVTYGNARILDGTWHNYAFTIRGDSVFTYADGAAIGWAQFENGADFSACTNPAIGFENPNFVGGLDEIFFFDGSQSENWMRLFYALQKQAMK